MRTLWVRSQVVPRCIALTFLVGAVFFVFRFSKIPEPEEPEREEEEIFLEDDRAVFLLIHENEGEFGPFTLINLDARAGRIPVFTFSGKAAIDYGGVYVSAESLFSSVSPEVFAGAIETNLGTELAGYFIWNRESAEKIISETGSFDYVLPENIKYTDGDRYVNLLSGVQNMTGKKICDIVECPDFSESERCDTFSRIMAAFLNKRLRRFLPESRVYPAIFNYTETDITAFDKERWAKLVGVLCGSGKSISGHITNDTERDIASGLIYFSEATEERIEKYFG